MRNINVVFVLMLMAGCASNSKTATTTPVQDGAQASQPQQPTVGVVEKPAALPTVSVATTGSSAETSELLDVQRKGTDAPLTESATLKTSQQTSQQGFEPYQWLTAWAKDVQEYLRPWGKTCETKQQKSIK
jgi:hypothetical protein